MTADIARLRELDLDYRGDVDPHDSAEEVMEMLPAIIAELERWRCATYSATPEALSEDVANSVLEHVEVMSELERLRRFDAMKCGTCGEPFVLDDPLDCPDCHEKTVDELERLRRDVIYECRTHGKIDARHAWGCPDCMREARTELERLRRLEAAVLAHRDLSKWCLSKCPACIDALSYCEAHTPECLRSVEAEDAAIAEARKAGEGEGDRG